MSLQKKILVVVLSWMNNFLKVLKSHAPLKKNYLALLMHYIYLKLCGKPSSRGLSYLEKIYFKKPTFLKSLKKTEKIIAKDNKLCWKTVKLFFRINECLDETHNKLKKNNLLQNDQEIDDELSTFFKNTLFKLRNN